MSVRFAWVLPCLLLVNFASAAEAPRPNVVLVLVDDFGYECVGADGGTSYATPRLDELAQTGLRFDHCHVQPLCTPTRVQLMTGMSNRRNYIEFGILDPEATTFGHLFREAGYATCVAGKWQLKGGFEGPQHFGFDDYCLWQLTRRPGRYRNPGLEIDGKEFDYTQGEYGPDLVNKYLCDFIEQHQDGPFFAYYPMMLTHAPYDATPDSDDYGAAPQARRGGRRRRAAAADGENEEGGGRRGKRDQAHFGDMVTYADNMVGRVMDKLDALGIRENTLLLVVGDNGTGGGVESKMGDKTVLGGKGKMTAAGTHVPFIASWPGVMPAGAVCSDLVDSTDFVPTLCDVASLTAPATLRFDGHSFAPRLKGEKGTPRRWNYVWYERDGRRDQAREMIFNQRYKLYRRGRFFDLKADPLEQNQLDVAALSGDARQAHDEFVAAFDEVDATFTGQQQP